MPRTEAASGVGTRQPYPGLRPFEPEEAIKFYGREAATAELLRRLTENRFTAVVGSSGSGKSSLVRAGLLPALFRGRLIGATSQWRICILRPGEAPMRRLAESLAAQVFFSHEDTVLQVLGRSSLGLVRAVREGRFGPGENLLIVVDQFEELFRFVKERKEQDGGAEARLFVASLLEAAELSSAPVYVVLTMRSDFFGDCSQFPGLPEALNRSQYLVPRMNRQQVRDAIEKPLGLVGAHMTPRLVERLLNELEENTGQLPVLQHALNRTFQEFQNRGAEDEIGIDDYAAAGELRGALDAHAERLLDSLKGQGAVGMAERWTERVFRCLTTVDNGLRIRRPTRLDHMFDVVGAHDEESRGYVRRVIDTYSDPDHAMLFWSGKELTGDSVVDISHESLIEHWNRLRLWLGAEAEAVSLFQNAAQDAVRKRRGAAARWRGRKLSEALTLIDDGSWNAVWAERLSHSSAEFSDVKEFVDSEAAAQTVEEEEEKGRRERELTAERNLKVAAEARATAEIRAREAAESLARTERLKNRSVSAAVMMGIVLLGLGLWKAVPAYQQLKHGKSEVELKREIDASDDILRQYANQERVLRSQMSDGGSMHGQDSQLKSKLTDLLAREEEVRELRRRAEARLSIDPNRQLRVNPIDGLIYAYIPKGAFTMGCSPGDNQCSGGELPPHAEEIRDGFWLGQTEVTQAAWKKVMNDNPSFFKSDQLPVEQVRWDQADDYCKKIGGRLPTEIQWEYAARGGAKGVRYGALESVAWYSANSGGMTHPVGLKQPNAFGLYDTLGNVWEWTADNYGTTGQYKILRGGDWGNDPTGIRVSFRFRATTTDQSKITGLRCVCEFR